MSTYEPGRLYLIDVDGETHEALYFANGINQPYFLTREGQAIRREHATNVRLAIVLDSENEDVQEFMQWASNFFDGYLSRLANKIRAQITPPEPPMEEPTEWGEAVTDDRGDWLRSRRWSASAEPWAARLSGEWSSWDDMQNPRPYEA